MSQENVEALRGFIGSIDDSGVDAEIDQLDLDVEFHEDPSFPEAKVYRGRDAVVRNFREFTESFHYYRFEIEDVRDAGDDRVMAVLQEQARGKASGVNVDRRSGWVITFRDGKVVRFEIYLDSAEALKAAGLEE